MKKTMEKIIEIIDRKSKYVRISFNDNSWRKEISSEAGWYRIITNTPIYFLGSVCFPKHKAHINIPETINSTSKLRESGIAISQHGNEDYVVYNGEAKNLRARAKEHVDGHAKTYCLGLANYKNLHGYRWVFSYFLVSDCIGILAKGQDDKLLRLAVEQGWRAFNGWPVLCRK